jgi:acetyltransferase-like isoleucine patch superfamily enzyme
MEYLKFTLGHCGKEVVLYPGVVLVGPTQIRIGAHTHIGDRCYLRGGGGIEIGEWCQIANNTIIVTENHNIDGGRYFGNVTKAKVVIGDNVWIGSNAIILPGVHIGENSVVAAGAVVTKDVPSNTVVAGVPARIKKKIETLIEGPIKGE